MKMKNFFSKFFVIEGLDGSGKSTQAKRLAKYFCAKNMSCIVTRQPSTGKIGELARAITTGEFLAENEALALLFAADRIQHYAQEIAPALERGEIVICDRYYYSNLVYQGTDSAAFERILSYNQAVMAARKPDAIIFIDVPPEECMRRITANRAQISIYEALDKLKLQRGRFLAAFERLNENVVIIEAENFDANAVFEKILHKIEPLCSN